MVAVDHIEKGSTKKGSLIVDTALVQSLDRLVARSLY